MNVQSSERISNHLSSLYDAYDDFDVQQTTVSVDDEEFASAAEQGDIAVVRVRVRGPEGILVVSNDDDWTVPGVAVVDDDRSLSTIAANVVRDQTGADCRINGLDRVDLVCLTCEDTSEAVYELSALFVARHESGSLNADARWRDALPEQSLAF